LGIIHKKEFLLTTEWLRIFLIIDVQLYTKLFLIIHNRNFLSNVKLLRIIHNRVFPIYTYVLRIFHNNVFLFTQ